MTSKFFLVLPILLGSLTANGHSGNHNHAEYKEHAEEGVKLPFDPYYCDLNDNLNIEADEMRPDNVCLIEGNQDVLADKPIQSLGLRKGELVLTIDDGPQATVTPKILDLLDQYNIKATFFLTGSRIAQHSSIVRDMARRGHVIGNHTFSHDVAHITANTITGEVLRAHQALVTALGEEPSSRLLFRAPGLAWNVPKAMSLNSNNVTVNYFGPLHANLGADAPRADWSCWSKGVSAQQCADYYFQDIVNTSRGIVLAHDVYYRAGRGNTYEMLKILLERLDREAGGIKRTANGPGVWRFISLNENRFPMLGDGAGGAAAAAPAAPGAAAQVDDLQPVQKTQDGLTLITQFAKPSYVVRNCRLIDGQSPVKEVALPEHSKYFMAEDRTLLVSDLLAVADLGQEIQTNVGVTFKAVRIESVNPQFQIMVGQAVCISKAAF